MHVLRAAQSESAAHALTFSQQFVCAQVSQALSPMDALSVQLPPPSPPPSVVVAPSELEPPSSDVLPSDLPPSLPVPLTSLVDETVHAASETTATSAPAPKRPPKSFVIASPFFRTLSSASSQETRYVGRDAAQKPHSVLHFDPVHAASASDAALPLGCAVPQTAAEAASLDAMTHVE